MPTPLLLPKRHNSCSRNVAPTIERTLIPHWKHVEVHSIDGCDCLQRQENRLKRRDDVDQLSIARFVRNLHLMMQIVVDFRSFLHIPSNLSRQIRKENKTVVR